MNNDYSFVQNTNEIESMYYKYGFTVLLEHINHSQIVNKQEEKVKKEYEIVMRDLKILSDIVQRI